MTTPTGLLGLGSIVTVGIQTDAVTPNTAARQSLNIYQVDGGKTESQPDDNVLGGGLVNASDPTAPAPGLDDHTLTIEAPVCVAQLPFWLKAFFGAPVASGTTPNYTQTYKSGAVPPWVTIEHQLSTTDVRRHVGCMGEELSIDWTAEKEGFATVTMKFRGVDENVLTAPSAGTITAAPTLSRPAQALTNVIYNGVSGGALIGGKLNFKRTLKRFRAADGTGSVYSVDQSARSSLSGSISTRYEDTTFVADAIARTLRSLSIQLMSTAQRGIQFTPNQVRLERTPISVKGPDAIMLDFNFKGWQDNTNAALAIAALTSLATVPL